MFSEAIKIRYDVSSKGISIDSGSIQAFLGKTSDVADVYDFFVVGDM